jgi:hypothetical protein
LRQIFAIYDVDNDGQILRNEAFNIVKAIGLSLPAVDSQASKSKHGGRRLGDIGSSGLPAAAAAAASTGLFDFCM